MVARFNCVQKAKSKWIKHTVLIVGPSEIRLNKNEQHEMENMKRKTMSSRCRWVNHQRWDNFYIVQIALIIHKQFSALRVLLFALFCIENGFIDENLRWCYSKNENELFLYCTTCSVVYPLAIFIDCIHWGCKVSFWNWIFDRIPWFSFYFSWFHLIEERWNFFPWLTEQWLQLNRWQGKRKASCHQTTWP